MRPAFRGAYGPVRTRTRPSPDSPVPPSPPCPRAPRAPVAPVAPVARRPGPGTAGRGYAASRSVTFSRPFLITASRGARLAIELSCVTST